MVLKWGIVSVGKISNAFIRAISVYQEENVAIAVAARDIKRAQAFATDYNIPKAYGDYKALAADPEIDVVYIGTIHPYHLEVSKLMLEHGKHVLCEKPLTMNEKQTKELLEFAKSKKLFLMEAIWSRCFPAYEKLAEILKNNVIGDVKYVNVAMGRSLNHIPRINLKELGGGTILDLGIYCLQFVQFVFKGLNPIKILSAGHLNEHNTDESVSIILTYPNGKTGVLSTSAVVEMPNEAVLIGTKGFIKIKDFWHPTAIEINGTLEKFELPVSKYDNERGLCYEVKEVNRCIGEGLLESPRITHAETLELSQLMDKIRKQVGVVYKVDL